MRIAVFGASGLLGRALVQEMKNEDLAAFSSKDADIRNVSRVQQAVLDARPDWVILSAAYTDVDGCESNRDLALAVNRDGAVNVAQAARQAGARLMFISTDYVFDGSSRLPYETNHPRNPINVYGETKAQAEERLLETLPDVCIVRTSWLFGAGGKCFPATILKAAVIRPELSVVNDQQGSPTFTTDLARALHELCIKNAHGLVHATNSGQCTWYEFAKEILAAAEIRTPVKPVSTAEFPRPARRPAYSVLSPKSLQAYAVQMPDWRDATRRYLSETQVLP